MKEVLTIMKHRGAEAFLGLDPSRVPVDRDGLEAALSSVSLDRGFLEVLFSRVTTMQCNNPTTLRRMLIRKQTRMMYECKAIKGFNTSSCLSKNKAAVRDLNRYIYI